MDIYLILSVFLGLSALMAFLFERLGFSRIAGYIIAGVLLSVLFSESINANKELLGFLSQIAITLLVFEIGREIGIERVRKMDPIPLIILGSEIFFAFILALLFGHLLKLDFLEILILALITSFSSTAILYRLMEDLKFAEDVKKQIMTVTIMEDIYALVILAILPSFKLGGFEFLEVTRFVALSLAIVALLILIGITIVKRLFVRIVEPNELGVAVILGSAFFFAILSKFLGLSPALGAFAAGVALSAHPKNKEIGEYLRPMREIFLILFFVSLGTEAGLIKEITPIIFLAPLVVFMRFLAFTSANWFVTGRALEESIRIGFVASCIGEFGIIVTYEAAQIGLVGLEFLTLSALSVILGAIISSSMGRNPDRYSGKIASFVPYEIKTVVNLISINVNKIAEGETSKVVQETFYRILRNVLILIIAIVVGSSVLYISDFFAPEVGYIVLPLVVISILFTILLIGINTKKYSEELCCIFIEKYRLNPTFKDVMVGSIFISLLLLSIDLAILVSGRFFTEVMVRLYKLDISNYIVLSVLIIFAISVLIVYRRLKKLPL